MLLDYLASEVFYFSASLNSLNIKLAIHLVVNKEIEADEQPLKEYLKPCYNNTKNRTIKSVCLEIICEDIIASKVYFCCCENSLKIQFSYTFRL